MRGPASFSSADRLHHSAEFRHLQRNGLRFETAHFVLYAGRSPGIEHARLGVTVSRRIGTAVVRNRVKRRIRECFRRNLRPLMPAGVAMVVIARPGAGKLDGAATDGELKAAALALGAKLSSRLR